eukprot:CAMPEP_0174915180 /NCGR_PEP_ID=MMETSP1355-20121228/616_1 /TAXON_ID=464990 /ORGANISM="Hemiselmis tepida, Strain CCMP443" /LENGTH=428 /DNA_ID=CAMNT_0016160019 /DNA_START=136 /DNA_END=1422 /DNA_ORIENTATION=-
MSIPAAFSPPLAIRPLRPFGNLATPLSRHTGVCLHAPPPSPGFYAIRRRSALRSSSPSSSLAERDGDADADFRGFGRAFAALLSALESRLLSVHDRLSRKRFERVAVAGVLLGLLTAVLRAAVGTSAHLFGALARIVGSAGGGPQEGGVSENVVGEGEVEEIAGEVPPLWELTAQHLAATKYGGRRASQREVEAMGVVRERVLGLTEGDKEAMDRAWVDSLTPVDLLRYVRGNGGEGRTAAEKLLATAVWRKDFGVTGILEEEETTIDAFFEGKVHEVDWLEEGADTESGRPSLLYRSAVHHPADIPTDRWVRFFVHQCEWARVHYPNDQVLVLVDRVGSGLSNQDPTVLRALAPVIVDHYPDTIGRVLIAPVNNVLYVIWGLVSLILDPTTKSRMKLIKGKDWRERLVECMDADKIPVRLGGTDTEL